MRKSDQGDGIHPSHCAHFNGIVSVIRQQNKYISIRGHRPGIEREETMYMQCRTMTKSMLEHRLTVP